VVESLLRPVSELEPKQRSILLRSAALLKQRLLRLIVTLTVPKVKMETIITGLIVDTLSARGETATWSRSSGPPGSLSTPSRSVHYLPALASTVSV
jgi:hypothetical protein